MSPTLSNTNGQKYDVPNLLNLVELDFIGLDARHARYRIERLDTRTEVRFHFQFDVALSTANPRNEHTSIPHVVYGGSILFLRSLKYIHIFCISLTRPSTWTAFLIIRATFTSRYKVLREGDERVMLDRLDSHSSPNPIKYENR